MASFIVYPADLSQPRVMPLDRRIIQIGSAADNDLILDGKEVLPHHVHVVYEKQVFRVASSEGAAVFTVGGRVRKNHKLADQDIIQIGEHLLRFVQHDFELKAPPLPAPNRHQDLQHFHALHRFSQMLAEATSVDQLLEGLLDELIGLTQATKAFLLLTLDGGRPHVHVARKSQHEIDLVGDDAISDSIVQQVLESGQPLIVADALSHEVFRSSQSVIRLKLSSVMCVPLKVRGSTLGVIYLGNDNAINHFQDDTLNIVSVFAAEGALLLENAIARQALKVQVDDLSHELEEKRFGAIVGASDSMRDVFKKISKIATTDITVLIQGETGTGKELVAHAIHEKSNRSQGPFVVINCGAIPENLLESELFGHMKGAFTGAIATRDGKFQAARGGTLFLDEVSEMPLALQVKMLRALQEKVVFKVGSTQGEAVDIRIVAATNRDLSEEVREGRFREDLFYRLNVVTLDLPPLRERGDDTALIARFLLKRWAPKLVGTELALSQEALQVLRRWRWPGNIRELENRIKKAIVFADNGIITPENLDLDPSSFARIVPLADARESWQRDYINRVLALNDGNRSQTARDLEVDPRTIFRHLERERHGTT